jgi:nucleoside phosphorylase
METKHTQGEWFVSNHNNELKVRARNTMMGTVCTINTLFEDEAEANAKLIANAPDMLSVLREAVDHAHVYDTNPALVELFEAVIQKATN